MSLTKLDANTVGTVTRSFGSCCRSATFFDDFYDKLMSSSPEIKGKFVNINMENQKRLLRHGVNYLIMFAKGSETAVDAMQKIGNIHARTNVNVDKKQYQKWGQMFIETVNKHDKTFTAETKEAWKAVLNHGMAHLYSFYNQ